MSCHGLGCRVVGNVRSAKGTYSRRRALGPSAHPALGGHADESGSWRQVKMPHYSSSRMLGKAPVRWSYPPATGISATHNDPYRERGSVRPNCLLTSDGGGGPWASRQVLTEHSGSRLHALRHGLLVTHAMISVAITWAGQPSVSFVPQVTGEVG